MKKNELDDKDGERKDYKMVTNARKIDFIQKIKDMQERTKASKMELLKKIDAKDEEYKMIFNVTQRQRDMIKFGGLLNMMKQNTK